MSNPRPDDGLADVTRTATSFALRPVHYISDPMFVRLQVFAGPDEHHRAHCGTLTMRESEAQDFLARFAGTRL